jgi:hypothetical protein
MYIQTQAFMNAEFDIMFVFVTHVREFTPTDEGNASAASSASSSAVTQSKPTTFTFEVMGQSVDSGPVSRVTWDPGIPVFWDIVIPVSRYSRIS